MRLLSSVFVLLAAWLLLLGGLGAGLSYVLTLPPPPPWAEPVSTYMPLPDPALRNPTLTQSAPLSTPSENAAGAEVGESVEVTEDTGAEDTGAENPGAENPGAENPGAEETGTEDPGAESNPETTATQTAESVESSEQPTESEGTGEPITIPLPKPKPPAAILGAEQTVELDQPEDGSQTANGLVTTDEQTVQVPLVPPAPEDLPYWERYRQPFNTEDARPRIAVVLTGLGLSDSATQSAIDNLPAAITLSFSPYARDLERWIALARARGHEVMLDLPMEPTTFPNDDPGPQALLTNLSPEDNLDRLDWVLSRGSAYVGVAGTMGSRFTASRPQMEPILKELKSRGLIFLDNRTTEKSVAAVVAGEIGLPDAFNNRSIDERQASRLAIDARLAQIERIALSEGFAVAMAQPYPVTLDRLVDWSTELTARGFAIAPISALVNRQESR